MLGSENLTGLQYEMMYDTQRGQTSENQKRVQRGIREGSPFGIGQWISIQTEPSYIRLRREIGSAAAGKHRR